MTSKAQNHFLLYVTILWVIRPQYQSGLAPYPLEIPEDKSSKPLQLFFLLPQNYTRLTKASCFPFSLVCVLNHHPHTPLCSYKGRMCHLSKSSMTLFLNSCFLQWNKNQTHNKHLGSVQWSLFSFLYVSAHTFSPEPNRALLLTSNPSFFLF